MTDRVRVALTMEQCWHRVPGGTAVSAIGTARALRDRGHVDVIGVAAKHSEGPREGYESPIEVRHMGLPRPLLYESWHRLRRPRIETATGPVDAIHATTIAVPPRSAPLVVTIHDLAFMHDPGHFGKRAAMFMNKGIDVTRSDADLVTTPSEATARDCEAAGISADRIRVVPFGIDVEEAPASAVAEVRRRFGLDKPYLLWTGTIEPRKNLPRLIEAWERCERSVDLVLVGPQGWKEDVDEKKRSFGELHVLGFVSRRDRDALYAGAEAFVWPSLLEGFGFPVLEALAQGTVVVTSRGTSTEELAGDEGVLVDPLDVDSIAEGIVRALDDDALRQRLVSAGPARAALYTWDRCAAAFEDVYRVTVGAAA